MRIDNIHKIICMAAGLFAFSSPLFSAFAQDSQRVCTRNMERGLDQCLCQCDSTIKAQIMRGRVTEAGSQAHESKCYANCEKRHNVPEPDYDIYQSTELMGLFVDGAGLRMSKDEIMSQIADLGFTDVQLVNELTTVIERDNGLKHSETGFMSILLTRPTTGISGVDESVYNLAFAYTYKPFNTIKTREFTQWQYDWVTSQFGESAECGGYRADLPYNCIWTFGFDEFPDEVEGKLSWWSDARQVGLKLRVERKPKTFDAMTEFGDLSEVMGPIQPEEN